MKIVSWNIEWMNAWFEGGSAVAFKPNNPNRGIADVPTLAQRVADVITDLAADVITVQEGPSDIREMELFVTDYLNGDYTVFGGGDGGAQKLYALVRNGGQFSNPALAQDQPTTDLSDPWEADVDGDEIVAHYDFTRRPLVVTGRDAAGNVLRVVSLHTKSKYVHAGQSLWNDPATRQQFIHEALMNRRRISAEAMRTRRFLDELLAADPAAAIVVTGDFNDGPGMDFFETRYLTHNVVDILLGTTFYPDRMFNHAFVTRVQAANRYTAIFDDYVSNIQNRPLLLDHILVSPGLNASIQAGAVCHQEFDAHVDANDATRQGRPSDHRPVAVELN